jgi:hypothetical protein
MPCEALFCSRFLTRNSKGAPFGFDPRVMSEWRWSCQRPVTFALLRTFVRIKGGPQRLPSRANGRCGTDNIGIRLNARTQTESKSGIMHSCKSQEYLA